MTRIPESFFAGCSSLSKVTFSSTILNIGSSAFAGCISLGVKEIFNIPNLIEEIGSNAFLGFRKDQKINFEDYSFESFPDEISKVSLGDRNIVIHWYDTSVYSPGFPSTSTSKATIYYGGVEGKVKKIFPDGRCSLVDNDGNRTECPTEGN